MESLKRLHFWIGFMGIIVFLLTGQYMYHVHDVLQGMDDGPRMLYRSAHIYFLLASVINLLMGVYFEPKSFSAKHSKWLQFIISFLILTSPVFILAGFFLEPDLTNLSRPYSKVGLFSLFAVAVLVIISELIFLRRKKSRRMK